MLVLNQTGRLDNDLNVYDLLPDDILEHVLIDLDCKSLFSLCDTNSRFSRYCNSEIGLNTIRTRMKEITGFNTRNFDLYRLKKLCVIHRHDKHLAISDDNLKDNICLTIRNGLLYSLQCETGLAVQLDLPFESKITKVVINKCNDRSMIILTEDGVAYMNGVPSGRIEFSFVKRDLFQVNHPENGDPKIIDIYFFDSTCYFLMENGYAYGLGSNRYQRLGIDKSIYHYSMDVIQIPGLKDVVGIGCSARIPSYYEGETLQYFSDKGGSVYKCGLTNKSPEAELVPEFKDIAYLTLGVHNCRLPGINRDGNVIKQNGDIIEKISNVVRLSVGFQIELFLTIDGNLYIVCLPNDYYYDDDIPEDDEDYRDYYTIGSDPIELARNVVSFTTNGRFIILMDINEDVYIVKFNRNKEGTQVLGERYITVSKAQFHDKH